MDNELIKMSDCPEIRDRWEPKVGDRVYSPNNKGAGTIIDCAELRVFFGMKSSDLCGLSVRKEKADIISIPRIEDVLEWLGDKPVAMETEGKDNDCLWDCYIPYGENGHTARQLIHALLRVYMQLEHGKTWNGEKWI